MRRVLLLIALMAGALGATGPVRGAETAAPGAPALTAEQQQAAVAFVKEHHPQLNTLIGRLKKRDPAEYDKALRDVSRNYERLQRLQTRDPQRYEAELKLWKVESRIRLLAARMAGDERPALESQLRNLLGERTDLRLQLLALERERLTTRIERVDSQVRQLSTERDAAVDKEIERLRRSVRARKTNVSKKSPPGKADPEKPQPPARNQPKPPAPPKT